MKCIEQFCIYAVKAGKIEVDKKGGGVVTFTMNANVGLLNVY
jgi:hypothetical protein